MTFLILLGVLIVVGWGYIFFLRPVLKKRYPATWEIIDRVEATLWDRSRTMLSARLYWLSGALVSIHELGAAAGLDWTPFTDAVGGLVPEQWRGLLVGGILIVTGLLFAWLRKVTTEALPKA